MLSRINPRARSAAVARFVRNEKVAGANPAESNNISLVVGAMDLLKVIKQ